MLQKVHKTIEIKAPVEKVFSYLDDPNNEPEWQESMVEVTDVCGSGPGAHFACSWKMAGIQFHGETTRTEEIPNKRIVDKTQGAGMNTRTYTFEPHGTTTTVDLDFTYTIPERIRRKLCTLANQLIFEQGEEVVYRNHIPLMAKLVDTFVFRHTEQEIEKDLWNIKERLEL